ncbi:Copper-transporting ATPase PAA1, chloroplastic [Sesamum alatum]|uniref:Copper-transporting ATPase PAA1, chloroplastic n=1 Tax=Sesamum alatum TaxID=300844 RepID=A0AAE1YY76_9LAMI|nr:Copper-transporting ATPase PAA1, chloroplastic [Sesamum alatum]
MESTLLSVGASTMSIFSLSKSLNAHSAPLMVYLHRRLSTAHPTRLAHAQLRRCGDLSRTGPASLVKGPGSLGQRRDRLRFAARSAASFAAGGGGFGGVDGGAGGGGGGDGAAEGGDAKPGAVAAGAADNAALGSDVIILDVGGMTCGGCAASVKRILESQPQVSSASVNLTTETAIVWPVSEAKVAPNWQKDIGEALAKHLTSCGFKSNLRDQGAIDGDNQS